MKAQRIKKKEPKVKTIGDLQLTIESGEIVIIHPQQKNRYRISESRGMLSILKTNEFYNADEILVKPVVSNRIMIH